MNYYDEIKNKLTQEEIYARVKDYSKERHKIETYYEVGKMLSEAGKHYGEDILGQYAIRLQKDVGKKYSVTTLKRMRQFFEMYEKSAPSAHQLTWSHYIELKVVPLKKEHIGQIELYMNYINRHLKTINENNTVGIIICLKNNKYVIEYCTNKNIISREYVLI